MVPARASGAAPGLRLYVREGIPDEQAREVSRGELDVVLGPLPIRGDDLEIEPLFREPLDLVAAVDSEFAAGTVSPEALAGVEARADAVFQVVHRGTPATSVQALILLQQVAERRIEQGGGGGGGGAGGALTAVADVPAVLVNAGVASRVGTSGALAGACAALHRSQSACSSFTLAGCAAASSRDTPRSSARL